MPAGRNTKPAQAHGLIVLAWALTRINRRAKRRSSKCPRGPRIRHTAIRRPLNFVAVCGRDYAADMEGDLVRVKGKWVTEAPDHCSNGHSLGANQVLVGHVACLGHGGGGHTPGAAEPAMPCGARAATQHPLHLPRRTGVSADFYCEKGLTAAKLTKSVTSARLDRTRSYSLTMKHVDPGTRDRSFVQVSDTAPMDTCRAP